MIKKLFSFVVIAVMIVSCSDQANDQSSAPVNPFMKTWTVSDVRFDTPTTDSASINMLSSMKQMMLGTTYQFDTSGTYTIGGKGETNSGKYSVSADNKTFTLGQTEKKLEFQILELTEEKLSFKNAQMPVILDCVPMTAAK